MVRCGGRTSAILGLGVVRVQPRGAEAWPSHLHTATAEEEESVFPPGTWE